jgi:serine/threonine protein kinase
MTDREFDMEPDKAYVRNGKIIIDDNVLELSGVTVEERLSEGANGTIFVGSDTLLNRKVAIKVWQRLRHKDSRDKIKQGLLEAQKAWNAQGKGVVQVYTAGLVGTHIYTVMEYINGVTLKQWLESEKRPLELRMILAWHLISTLKNLESKDIYHGDLHSNNIIIYKIPREPHHGRGPERYVFKIIDFGTSHFSNGKFSIRRHYRLIEETLDEILTPLKIELLYEHCRPKQYNHGEFLEWLTSYLVLLSAGLISLRFPVSLPPNYAIHPDMGLEWSYFDDEESKTFLSRLKEFIVINHVSKNDVEGSSNWHVDFAV